MAVNLPQIQDRTILARASQSQLSAADIASPYTMLAQALDKEGQGLTKVATAATGAAADVVKGATALKAGSDALGTGITTLAKGIDDTAVTVAEQVGQRAVTIGDDGLPQVEMMPPFTGRVGAAYNRAASHAYLARLQPVIDKTTFDKRLEFQADPAQFDTWAKSYSDQLVTNAPNDALKNSVRAYVDGRTGETSRGLQLAKNNRDITAARTSLVARASDLDNQLAALARQGGVGTPEYTSRMNDARAIYSELSNNPLYGYPKASAESDLAAMTSRHQAEAVIGSAERVYDKSGRAEAKKFLETSLWSPDLNLTESQRGQYVARGLSALDAKTADQSAAIQANRAVVSEQIKSLGSGGYYDPRTHNDLVEKSVRLGDAESVYKLEAWAVMNQQLRSFNAASEPDRRQMLERAQSGQLIAQPAALNDNQRKVYNLTLEEARRQGVNPTLAAAIAWQESKLGANTTPRGPDGQPLSTAQGPFQQLAATRAATGVPDNAPVEAQVRGGVAGLKQTVADLKISLGRDPTPAEVYIGHFLGTGAAKAVLSASPDADLKQLLDSTRPGWADKMGHTWGEVVIAANPFLANRKTVGDFRDWASGIVNKAFVETGAAATGPNAGVFSPANPYSAVAVGKLVNEYRTTMSASLDTKVTGLMDALKKRETITPEEIGSVVYWVQQTGNFAAGTKMADFLETYDKGSLLANLPEAQRKTVLGAMRAKAATGGADQAQRAVIDFLGQQDKIRSDALKADPLTEFATRGWTSPPAEINVADPQSLATALQQNDHAITVAHAHDPTVGAVPALPAGQLPQLGQALVSGDPQNSAALLGVLGNTVSSETYRATLSAKPVKDALDGMVRSYDPVRLNAAMSSLDRFYRLDPVGFKETFGGDTFKRLQVWQAWKDTASPLEVADRFKRADDPAVAGARKELGKVADAEMKKIKVGDVVSAFGSWVPFTGPSPPADSLQAARLHNEFETIYKDLRQYGVEPDKAKEQAIKRLGTVWGASDLMGGSLMRYPPERYYPANPFDNGHAWMRRQVDEYVNKAKATSADLPTVAAQAFQQYPIIADAGVSVVQSQPSAGGNNKLEFWPPGEKGDASAPRPAELPLDKPGVQLFSPDVKPGDVAADVVSHHLVNTDTQLRPEYQKFLKTFQTTEGEARLRKDYEFAKQNEGETRAFKTWATQTRIPAYLRGYVFGQWPSEFNATAFTPEQKTILDRMKADISARTPDAQSALGGMPDYGGSLPNWSLKAIVSDAQTEAEIAAGKKPSYHIVVTDNRTGQIEPIIDPKSGSSRFAFDPSATLADAEHAFNEKRAKALDWNKYIFPNETGL